jgi:hypothetical protein
MGTAMWRPSDLKVIRKRQNVHARRAADACAAETPAQTAKLKLHTCTPVRHKPSLELDQQLQDGALGRGARIVLAKAP